MQISRTTLDGVYIVNGKPSADHRGAFERLYCERELKEVIGARRIVQINHSRTREVGAIRGMHYQHPPHVEMKLIRCLKGRVWDVAVDLRADSPSFLQWHAEELAAGTGRMLVISEGFAHGFQVLDAESELLYLHTAFYRPEAEGGVSYADPALKIAWPLPVNDISQRDRNHPPIGPGFNGIVL